MDYIISAMARSFTGQLDEVLYPKDLDPRFNGNHGEVNADTYYLEIEILDLDTEEVLETLTYHIGKNGGHFETKNSKGEGIGLSLQEVTDYVLGVTSR